MQSLELSPYFETQSALLIMTHFKSVYRLESTCFEYLQWKRKDREQSEPLLQ